MDLSRAATRAQRVLLLALVPATALAVWRPAPDAFALPKATIVWAVMLVVTLLSGVRVAADRRVRIPISPLTAALLAFVIAATLTTITSPTPGLSLIGEYQRYTGLLSYAVYALVAIHVVRIFDVDECAWMLRLLTATLVPVGLYGLLQLADVQPIDWGGAAFGRAFATLGNANVLAGFLAIGVPAAVWVAMSGTLTRLWRIAAAVAAVGAVLVAAGSGSYQGPAAGVPGALVVLAIWLSTDVARPVRSWCAARSRGQRIGGLAVAAVALLAVSPLLASSVQRGLNRGFLERGAFWRAALSMFGHDPVLGVGFDTYGQHFLAEREASHAVDFLNTQAESAHSVPLNLLAGGGLVVLLAWLAVVGVTAWALVVGLRRLGSEERLLLGGLAGCWVAYLLQALVSFDSPTIALLHALLAGAIVAIGAPPHWREVVLSGAPAVPAQGRRRAMIPTSTWVAIAVLVVIGLVGLVQLTRPLRADLAAARAADQFSEDPQAALASVARATEIAPWQGRHWLARSQANEAAAEPFAATGFAEEAARREPGSSQYALLAGRLNVRYRSVDEARVWFDEAIARDPHNPLVLAELGQFEAEAGDVQRGRELLAQAEALAPTQPAVWMAWGAVHGAAGDLDEARAAYERALELSPGLGAAITALIDLDEAESGSG